MSFVSLIQFISKLRKRVIGVLRKITLSPCSIYWPKAEVLPRSCWGDLKKTFGQLLTLAHAISASMSAGMSPQLFFCCSWTSLVVSHSCRAALSFWNFCDRDKAFSRSCLPSVTCTEKEIEISLKSSQRYCIFGKFQHGLCFSGQDDLISYKSTQKIRYLSPEVIIEQLESSELLVHGLGVLRLLFLHNLSTCLYHRLHLQLHLTQQLV